jgi:hypothetical protein
VPHHQKAPLAKYPILPMKRTHSPSHKETTGLSPLMNRTICRDAGILEETQCCQTPVGEDVMM